MCDPLNLKRPSPKPDQAMKRVREKRNMNNRQGRSEPAEAEVKAKRHKAAQRSKEVVELSSIDSELEKLTAETGGSPTAGPSRT